MATWKKIIVSGSNISQLNNDTGYITSASAIHLSASDGGAITAPGSITLDSTGSISVNYDSTYITSSGAGAGNLTIASGSIDSSRIAVDEVEFRHLTSSLIVTSVDVISDLTTGSDDNISTTKAVKEYVDSQVGDSNNLDITASNGSIITIDLTDEDLTLTSGSDAAISTDATGNSVLFGLNTSSAHFTAGVREKISTTDTTGASGIDMSYDSSTGVISGSLLTSSIHIGDGATSIALGATGSTFSGLTASGSFSGSFEGDGSGLTGVASTLNVSSSDAVGISIDLKTETLTIAGTANEIETSGSGNTITVGLPNDVTVGNNLTVGGNLVVQGTQTNLNTTNLDVEDRYILLNSGSGIIGDSGIVFGGSDGTVNSGSALIWDASYNSNDGRLAVTGEISGGATGDQTPSYHIAGVYEGTEGDAETAQADHPGNIRIEGTDIFIYV